MNPACGTCGRSFERGPGYLLGSIYFNYGVTAAIVVVGYLAAFVAEFLSGQQRLVVFTLFSILFPLWFFRYARALWIAFDECFDPWPNDEEQDV